MTSTRTDELDELLRSGIEPLGIASAAIFSAVPDGTSLELGLSADAIVEPGLGHGRVGCPTIVDAARSASS